MQMTTLLRRKNMATVLIVDDEEDIRELVGIYLKMKVIIYARQSTDRKRYSVLVICR